MKKFESLNASKFEALDNKAMGTVLGGLANGETSEQWTSTSCTKPGYTNSIHSQDGKVNGVNDLNWKVVGVYDCPTQ